MSTIREPKPDTLPVTLARLAWVPCYQYALAKHSRLMLWVIWCILARIDPERQFYAPLLRPWLWRCRKCGKTFARNRSFSTTTHNDSECAAKEKRP